MTSTRPTVVMRQPLKSGQMMSHRGPKGGAVVEALRLQNQRRGGNQRKIEPDDAVEHVRRERIEAQPGDDLRIGAQHIRQPEAHREQTGVRQLVDLRSNLAVTSQHGFKTSTVGRA